jgi:hypothetical protein
VHAVVKVKSGYRFTHSSYLSDLFYVDKKAYESIDWPKIPFTLDDERFWYSYSHGQSKNPALAEIQRTYVPNGRYS